MDYQKQGKDFLTKAGVKFSIKFIEYGAYFEDDKESRDIFKVTFSRMIEVRSQPEGELQSKHYKNRKKSFSIRFGQSITESDGNGGSSPTPYDVLVCLTKNEPGSFADFCGDFGYNTDSRKVEKIYKAVCKEWEEVSGFFTQAEIEEMQEIQ